MKTRHIIALSLCAAMAVSCIKKLVTDDEALRFNPDTDRISLSHEYRAAWLTTVQGIDWPDRNDDAATQKRKLVDMIKGLKAVGINVIYMQMMSNQDACYASDILPWSHVLTGTQGKDPGYDPLALAVRTCREEGLEIHAWLNPFRCGTIDFERDPRHIALRHPEYVLTYGQNWFLDPALPGVREYLASVVSELIGKYDLDGIHIDDYFYPDGLQADEKNWDDSGSYALYGGGMDKTEWRYANVNACVRALHEATHAAKPTAVFGVSPAGRLVNTRKLYADPTYWVEEGTVDYLVPQIYWQHGHAIADFTTVLASWKDVVGSVPMFTGLASYRYGEKGFESLSEYGRQVEECREAPYVLGEVWFPAKSILRDDFKAYLKGGVYKYPSLVPKIGWSDGFVPERPSVSLGEGGVISWPAVAGATSYAVYVLEREDPSEAEWTACLVDVLPEDHASAGLRSWKGASGQNYAVLAVSDKEKSPLSEVVFVQ